MIPTIRWAFACLCILGTVALAQEPNAKDAKKEAPKDDVTIIDVLTGGDEATLDGKAKKLVIKTVTGGAQVDCGKLEVEEIEIGMASGNAMITLKLDGKAKLKKLTIGSANGNATIDAGLLDVAEIEIGAVAGNAKFVLQSTGNIRFKSIAGSPVISIGQCKDLVIDQLGGSPVIDASYFGEAQVPDGGGDDVMLKKIEKKK